MSRSPLIFPAYVSPTPSGDVVCMYVRMYLSMYVCIRRTSPPQTRRDRPRVTGPRRPVLGLRRAPAHRRNQACNPAEHHGRTLSGIVKQGQNEGEARGNTAPLSEPRHPGRRRWEPHDKDGATAEWAIQRTPDAIIDTRLNGAQDKGSYRCDVCATWYTGPCKGKLLHEVREMSFDGLRTGWVLGTADASWYCVDCWGELFGERGWGADTREILHLPPASRPTVVTDQRFNANKRNRWAKCDRCAAYSPGRARDYHYGSFDYRHLGNGLAGPGSDRSTCFRKTHDRKTLWELRSEWNWADACRTCLPVWWDRMGDIETWLHIQRYGARNTKVVSRQRPNQERINDPRYHAASDRRR